MQSQIHAAALAYLRDHRVMTLATTGAEGPWAAAVFYASKNFELYFLSAGHTRHARNFTENGKAAAAIQEDYADWPAIKGIQLEGVVTLLQGSARTEAIALYKEKYPFIKNAVPQIQLSLAKVHWYRLEPQRLYFIDNSKGLGHRDEVDLA